ncbi:uncharacterized protein LOC143023523 [Oratosquilla oratoria]|uniref:uncharacterized protein LOC143023523 n=1 Tax=Oratosquilla oratoria TaxID=337810 RepID=UPI003F776ECA
MGTNPETNKRMNENEDAVRCHGDSSVPYGERTQKEIKRNLNKTQPVENSKRNYKCPHGGHLNGTGHECKECHTEDIETNKNSQHNRDDGKTNEQEHEQVRKYREYKNCDETTGRENSKPNLLKTQQIEKENNTGVFQSSQKLQQQCGEDFTPRSSVPSSFHRYNSHRERHRGGTPLGSLSSSMHSSTGSLDDSTGSMSSSYGPSSLSESLGGSGFGVEGQRLSYSSRVSSNSSLQTSRSSTPVNSSRHSGSTTPTSTPVLARRYPTRVRPRHAAPQDSSSKFLLSAPSPSTTTSSRRSQSRASTPLGSSRSRRSRSQTPRPKCESDSLPTPGLQQEALTRALLYPSSLHRNLRLAAMFFVSAYVGFKTMKDFFLSLPIFQTATVDLSPTSVKMGLL